ncbi:MAG: Rho termination factor N-terminal domain-containing protein [Deltaproteobacteria bacterium]|nr:Rho termination factor N-terminal domain-containing protein [Deltaproteobacteria bacterium]
MANTKKNKKKPLEKLTAKELREIAFEIPEITGAHGMNKSELLNEIKKARGIEEKKEQKKSSSVRELKVKINELKIKRDEAIQAKDSKKASMFRRRISKLKKKTRRAA